MDNGQKQYYTLPEAAKYLGIGVPTLRWHIRYGRLPVIRLTGRTRLIKASDLEELLKSCRVRYKPPVKNKEDIK